MARYVTFLICLVYAISDVSNAQYLPELEIRQVIVNTHNALRRKVATRWADRGLAASNMRKMSWDEDLANEAVNEAACESLEGSSVVSSSAGGGGSSVMFFEDFETMGHGKNVALSSQRNIRQMIMDWSSEERHFNYKYQTCVPGNDCTAFKQMIWARASRVGCSLNPYCEQDGESVKLFVCMYNEKASILFDLYSIGPVCSRCDAPTGFCEDALCVSSCHGSASGECGCQKTCHHPGIGEGALDEGNCTCHCAYGLGPDCEELCENPQPYIDFDFCADMNNPDSCEMDRLFQLESCPANCDYGCRSAP